MSRFRTKYRELSAAEKTTLRDLKEAAEELEAHILETPDGREKYMAMTKLEEVVMWAMKGVTGWTKT